MDRILGFDTQTLIQMGIMLFNILLTVYIVQRLLYKPVLKYLEKRTDKISKQVEDTENTKMETEGLKKQYEERLIHIEDERNDILDTANKRAKEKSSQIIIEAKTEAKIIKNRTTLDIEREKDKANDEMKKEIIQISNILASKYVSKSMDEETENKLLDEVISDLGGVKWQN